MNRHELIQKARDKAVKLSMGGFPPAPPIDMGLVRLLGDLADALEDSQAPPDVGPQPLRWEEARDNQNNTIWVAESRMVSPLEGEPPFYYRVAPVMEGDRIVWAIVDSDLELLYGDDAADRYKSASEAREECERHDREVVAVKPTATETSIAWTLNPKGDSWTGTSARGPTLKPVKWRVVSNGKDWLAWHIAPPGVGGMVRPVDGNLTFATAEAAKAECQRRDRAAVAEIVGPEQTAQPELNAIVELVEAIPGDELKPGAVGTVVELFDDGAFDAEFTNDDGETIATLLLRPEQCRISVRTHPGRTLMLLLDDDDHELIEGELERHGQRTANDSGAIIAAALRELQEYCASRQQATPAAVPSQPREGGLDRQSSRPPGLFINESGDQHG